MDYKLIDGNKVIWETENFVAFAVSHPFVSREEGGHIIIRAKGDKFRFNSRIDFTPELSLEQQRLSQMLSEAYIPAMERRGIDIIRINYFEAWNWAWKKDKHGNNGVAHYHEHIFGRVADAKSQKFPDAPYLPDRSTGFYDNFIPLDDEDIECIIEEMLKLDTSEKYEKSKWKI